MDKAEAARQVAMIESQVKRTGISVRCVLNGHEVRASLRDDAGGQYVAFALDGRRRARNVMAQQIVAAPGGWKA